MRHQSEKSTTWEAFEPVEWPESSVDIDDDTFARAIAEGRRPNVAA